MLVAGEAALAACDAVQAANVRRWWKPAHGEPSAPWVRSNLPVVTSIRT
jgi:hypothetical protein